MSYFFNRLSAGDGYIRRAQLNQFSSTYSQGAFGYIHLIDMCNKDVNVVNLTTAVIWSFSKFRTRAMLVSEAISI